jgi:hypothetical protein
MLVVCPGAVAVMFVYKVLVMNFQTMALVMVYLLMISYDDVS